MIKMFVKLKDIKKLEYGKDYLFREAFPEISIYFFDKVLTEVELDFSKWAVVEYKEKEIKGCKQKIWVIRRIKKTFFEKLLDK